MSSRRRRRMSSAVSFDPLTPSGVSDLKAWWDFSDATTLYTDAGVTPVTTTNDLIYQANDKSGNGNHMVQATAGNRPLYAMAGLNGRSVVRFVSSDSLSAGNLGAQFPDAGTVVVVATVNTGTYALFQTAGLDAWWGYNGGSYLGPWLTPRVNNLPSSGEPTSGTHIWAVTSNASEYKMWRNGSTAKLNTTAGYLAGNLYTLPGQNQLTGDIAEVLLFSVVLSVANLNILGAYLAAKWGTTWTTLS